MLLTPSPALQLVRLKETLRMIVIILMRFLQALPFDVLHNTQLKLDIFL